MLLHDFEIGLGKKCSTAIRAEKNGTECRATLDVGLN